jgi:hypothetical protein
MKKFDKGKLERARRVLDEQEAGRLSALATLNKDATRRAAEERWDTDYRQGFSIDVDRILHAHAYARYIDKTRCFTSLKTTILPIGFCTCNWYPKSPARSAVSCTLMKI